MSSPCVSPHSPLWLSSQHSFFDTPPCLLPAFRLTPLFGFPLTPLPGFLVLIFAVGTLNHLFSFGPMSRTHRLAFTLHIHRQCSIDNDNCAHRCKEYLMISGLGRFGP